MQELFDALMHTPWWVYLIFAYCLFVGYKGVKGGVVPFWKMLAMPVVFTVMSVETLFISFSINFFVLTTYLVAMLVGVVAGVLYARAIGLEADSRRWLLKFPGSWSSMILIILIFAVKYYFGYQTALDPTLLQNTHFEFWMLSISSVITGVFIGRAIFYFLRIKRGPSVDLGEDSSK